MLRSAVNHGGRRRHLLHLKRQRRLRLLYCYRNYEHVYAEKLVAAVLGEIRRRYELDFVKNSQRFGATLVDQIVTVSPVENYVVEPEMPEVRIANNAIVMSLAEDVSSNVEVKSGLPNSGRVYAYKAQEVVSSMIAKGSAISQDAVNKAKAFDEKHQLTASASAKVISFDRRVGLTEKLTVGISMVNEKVKSVDQRLHVSDKTMAAVFAAERKLNDTGSAVKSSRYVTAGAAWLNGAFSKVTKAGQVAGTKTREKFHLAVSNLTAKDPIAA